LTNTNGDLDFGFMGNAKSNESSLYQIMVYTVVYLCIVALLNVAVIGLTSLDESRLAKWLNIILCCAHATGLVFIVLIYGIRYISQWKPPLRNYYLDIFGVLVDFILILLLIMFKRSKELPPDTGIDEIRIDDNELTSRLSSKKTKKGKNPNDPQLISEGLATPLYQNGAEYVEHQPTITAKPTIDQNKIVVSDNIVGNETYMDNNGNQYPYNPNQPMEVNTNVVPSPGINATPYGNPQINPSPVVNATIPSSPYANPAVINNQSPQIQATVPEPKKINSQYTYAESNPYPEASSTVYKLPEIPIVSDLTSDNNKK